MSGARPTHAKSAKAPGVASTPTPRRGNSVKTPPIRIEGLDAWRGIAIAAMVAYHFCFDLRYFGVTRADFEHDPFWLAARSLILGSFMLIAGVSLVLARQLPDFDRRFVAHVAKIVVAAMLVTGATVLMFPRSFIWFGVLHAIAVSLLIARPLVAHPRIAAGVGVVMLVAGVSLAHPAFDNRVLGFLGFMTAKPRTEDYVPLFPWAGLALLGVGLGHWLAGRAFAPVAPLARAPRWLGWMGRHSLAIYLVHQPVLLGLLYVALRG